MHTLTATNVNDAFEGALYLMKAIGVKENSRNGEVMAAPYPVATTYKKPTQRMLFSPKRDANPFFHIMEGIWMLAGFEDVEFPARFASNILNFSDDKVTLNGAYGHRWRNKFAVDQLHWVIGHLSTDPDTRRAVISMWDPNSDPNSVALGSKDVPCNTTIYFRNIRDKLNMTVCCRSNDIIWGCYGANAVHMSMLHEYVAESVGLEVGEYVQISNNWHIYPQHYSFLDNPMQEEFEYDFAHIELTLPGQVTSDTMEFRDFVRGHRSLFKNRWLAKVGVPLIYAHETFKSKGATEALKVVDEIQDGAIWYACRSWLERRVK